MKVLGGKQDKNEAKDTTTMRFKEIKTDSVRGGGRIGYERIIR